MGGKIIKFIFIILVLSFTCNVFGYNNLVTHPLLSESAAEIYNQWADNKLTDRETAWIIKGSIDEDNDPRYINHFFNPLTGEGLNGYDKIGGLTFKVRGQSAKAWAKTQNSATGDYSESAILKNYKNGNLTRAYQGIGHIIHLIQDMSVPAHSRNDPHAGGDPYEKWAEQYTIINPSKLSFLNINNLDQAFDQMAGYSNNNFFSKDSIDLSVFNNYKIVVEKNNNLNVNYLVNNINGNNYRLCKLDNSSIKPICKINDDDFKLNLDYWNLLYPKAVGYSAGVIDYFLKQFEQIDKSKKEQEQISTWNKLKNYFAWLKSEAQYIWGDVFMAQRNALVRSYDSLVAFITNTRDDVQNFSDANREIVEQTVNQAGQVLSAFEQAGTAEEIFNFQPTRAENEPENNGIPLTLETPLGDYFIKDSEEIPLSSDTGGGGENPLATPEQPAEEGEEPLVEKTPLTPVSPAGYGNTAPTFIFVAGDSTPPETTITSAPGEIINLNSADFIFASSESNSTFDCNLNDAGWEICASPYNLINLSDRDYIFKVRARDAANNIDQTPAEYSLTVDTTAPEITVLSGPPAIASSTTANFEFNSSEDETSYQCRLDANSWETCSASTSAFNLIEGDHSLEVKGSDPAGNIGSSTLITWLLDLTAPTSTMVSLEAVYETVGFTVAWSGEDVDATGSSTPVSGLADFTVQYKIDAGDWKNWLNATTSTSTIFNLSVASGQTVYFRVKAGDNAGNLGEWSAQAQTKINSSPGAILNLTAIMASTTVSSITLSWSSPENGRLNDTAYYEIKYQEKNGDCSLQLNWDSAIAVASSSLPAPGEIFGAAESARVTGLSSNKEYCLAVRTFNGLYWSDLSNQVNAVTSQNKITAGDTSTAYGNWQSAFSWKHTVSGDDPILVVSVHGDGGYLNANSVTYNGQPLTLAVSKVRDQSYNNLAVSIYYLANPPKGEYTIEVSIGWPFPFSASAITFNNCDTADPVNLAGASLESLASTVNSLEITKPKAMIIDAVTYNQPESFSLAPGQGQTQYFTNYQWGQANDLHSSGSYKLAEQAGTQTMAWNTLDDRTSVHAFIVLNPKP